MMTNLDFHYFRHPCATCMVQGRVDRYKMKRLLGHKSPST